MSHIVHVKCISHAFDSRNAVQYFPGYEYDLDLADREQRKLVWLKTDSKINPKWIFQFDRASSSNTACRIFFCKECGTPFDRLQDLGNHTKTEHPPNKKDADITQSIEADAEEERLLQERRAAEEAEMAEAK